MLAKVYMLWIIGATQYHAGNGVWSVWDALPPPFSLEYDEV